MAPKLWCQKYNLHAKDGKLGFEHFDFVKMSAKLKKSRLSKFQLIFCGFPFCFYILTKSKCGNRFSLFLVKLKTLSTKWKATNLEIIKLFKVDLFL